MTPLIESIYQKYISIFYEIDNGGTWIDLSVVRYALRAALRELGEPTLGRSKEIVRLNDWLFEHAPDLAHDPHTDTAEAMIAAAHQLRRELQAVQAERDHADQQCALLEQEAERLKARLEQALEGQSGLVQQLAQMDADNTRLTQELAVVRSWSVAPHHNGSIIDNYGDAFGTVITNPPVAQPSAQSAQSAQSADSLPAVPPALTWPDPLADWVEGLERGRHEWRKLPRDVRWRLIANVVQQVKTSVAFDAHRPQWMTSARAAALTFGDGLWENVVERARWLNE